MDFGAQGPELSKFICTIRYFLRYLLNIDLPDLRFAELGELSAQFRVSAAMCRPGSYFSSSGYFEKRVRE